MSRRARRHTAPLVTLALGAAGALLLIAPPASAHVRVIGDVIPGKPATLQFRVPSELRTATTVRIAVDVPNNLTVTGVPPVDGWRTQRAAGPGGRGTRLVWTAKPGHEIKPAASKVFPVRVGAVPDTRSLTFATEQTYSNGTISSWTQPQQGAEEPEFPAPTLLVDPTAPDVADEGAGAPRSAPPTSTAASVPSDPTVAAAAPRAAARDGSSGDTGHPWLYGGGGLLAVALLAGGVVVAGRARR